MGEQGAQFGGAQRFVQQRKTGLADAQNRVGGGVAGHQNRRNVVAELLPQAGDDFDAVGVAGQAVIRHDDVGNAVEAGQPLFGFGCAVRGDQIDPPVVEQLGHAAQDRAFVVHQQHQGIGGKVPGSSDGRGRLDQASVAAGHVDTECRAMPGARQQVHPVSQQAA